MKINEIFDEISRPLLPDLHLFGVVSYLSASAGVGNVGAEGHIRLDGIRLSTPLASIMDVAYLRRVRASIALGEHVA